MQKRVIYSLFLILLLSTSAFAQLDDFNDKTFLDMHFNVKGSFDIVENSRDAKVAEIISNLTFFPKNEINQQVLTLKTISSPVGSIIQTEEGIGYIWNEPEENVFTFGLSSDVRVRNSLVIIDKKIDFPVGEIETYYTKESE